MGITVVVRMKMANFMRGESLLTKMATIAKYGVFPGAMLGHYIYSPPYGSKRFAKKYPELAKAAKKI